MCQLNVLRSVQRIAVGFLFGGYIMLLSGCSAEHVLQQPSESSAAVVLPYDISKHKNSIHIFNALTLEEKIQRHNLQERLDYLYVILDLSEVMNDEYRDLPLHVYAKEMLRRFHKTMPPGFKGRLYVYTGSRFDLDGDNDFMVVPAATYDPQIYQQSLDQQQPLMKIGGDSLASAIDLVSQQINAYPGRSALVVFSRWQQMDEKANQAFSRLRQGALYPNGQKIGEQVIEWKSQAGHPACIYVVGVGNSYSRQKLQDVDTCGFAQSADSIAQPQDMTHFVERILFAGPADRDGDGIFDYKDRCPDTAPGRIVGFDGCYRFGVMQSRQDSIVDKSMRASQ